MYAHDCGEFGECLKARKHYMKVQLATKRETFVKESQGIIDAGINAGGTEVYVGITPDHSSSREDVCFGDTLAATAVVVPARCSATDVGRGAQVCRSAG